MQRGPHVHVQMLLCLRIASDSKIIGKRQNIIMNGTHKINFSLQTACVKKKESENRQKKVIKMKLHFKPEVPQ